MRRQIRLNDECDHLEADGLEVIETPYGWSVFEKPFSEWRLDVRLTSRQDGKASWGVIYTDVDGAVHVRQGLHTYGTAAKHIVAAIRESVEHWIEPLSAVVVSMDLA